MSVKNYEIVCRNQTVCDNVGTAVGRIYNLKNRHIKAFVLDILSLFTKQMIGIYGVIIHDIATHTNTFFLFYQYFLENKY